MEKCISRGDRLFFSSSAVTDVYYVVRKQTGNKTTALTAVTQLSKLLSIAEVDESCILSATLSPIDDFEDAVVDAVATKINANFIMTRNLTDYQGSKHIIFRPSDFLINSRSKIAKPTLRSKVNPQVDPVEELSQPYPDFS